jgi:hypothetical protein
VDKPVDNLDQMAQKYPQGVDNSVDNFDLKPNKL